MNRSEAKQCILELTNNVARVMTRRLLEKHEKHGSTWETCNDQNLFSRMFEKLTEADRVRRPQPCDTTPERCDTRLEHTANLVLDVMNLAAFWLDNNARLVDLDELIEPLEHYTFHGRIEKIEECRSIWVSGDHRVEGQKGDRVYVNVGHPAPKLSVGQFVLVECENHENPLTGKPVLRFVRVLTQIDLDILDQRGDLAPSIPIPQSTHQQAHPMPQVDLENAIFEGTIDSIGTFEGKRVAHCDRHVIEVRGYGHHPGQKIYYRMGGHGRFIEHLQIDPQEPKPVPSSQLAELLPELTERIRNNARDVFRLETRIKALEEEKETAIRARAAIRKRLEALEKVVNQTNAAERLDKLQERLQQLFERIDTGDVPGLASALQGLARVSKQLARDVPDLAGVATLEKRLEEVDRITDDRLTKIEEQTTFPGRSFSTDPDEENTPSR